MKPSGSLEASECNSVGSLNCMDLFKIHLTEHCRCLVGYVTDKTFACCEPRACEKSCYRRI